MKTILTQKIRNYYIFQIRKFTDIEIFLIKKN